MIEYVELLNSVGFPIFACGCLFWKMNKSDSEHKDTILKLTEVLERNTLALEKLGGNSNE